MKKGFFYFLIAGLIGFSSCKENTADGDEAVVKDTVITITKDSPETLNEIIDAESTDAVYEDADKKGYNKISSDRYGFSFEIPKEWTATDKSNNGDGYFLSNGDKTVDLRVYGENLKGNEVMAEMELKTCETSEKFTFRNGYPGIKCKQSGDYYYYYDTPKTRVIFYVHAPKKWIDDNAILIETIAKSVEVNGSQFQ